jgi:hypothetical protein
METVSETTRQKLDALNKWLSAVFGEGQDLSHLLSQNGLSEADVTRLKNSSLTDFLESVLDIVESRTENQTGHLRNSLMIRLFGLRTGQPEDRYAIGHSVGVNGERIRQLVNRRLEFYKDPQRKEALELEIVQLAKQLLHEG